MPWLFLLFVIFGIAGGVVALSGRHAKVEQTKVDSRGVAVLCAIVAVLLLAWSSVTIVSTRNVGVLTSFGRPVGTLSNGIHPKAPWTKKHELNGTIQTNWKRGGFDGGKCSGGTTVRLANNSTACVDNSVRWRISPHAADALFRDYQNDTNIRDSLVTRALEASLNDVFNTYNPLAPEASTGPNLAELAARATAKLRERTAGQVEVLEIIIAIVHFDEPTQLAINKYQTQLQETRVAEARQQTALAEAEANRRLADSVRNDSNVLVARCLDLVNAGRAIGLSCWPINGVVPLSGSGR